MYSEICITLDYFLSVSCSPLVPASIHLSISNTYPSITLSLLFLPICLCKSTIQVTRLSWVEPLAFVFVYIHRGDCFHDDLMVLPLETQLPVTLRASSSFLYTVTCANGT
jgi:hypothetical protein